MIHRSQAIDDTAEGSTNSLRRVFLPGMFAVSLLSFVGATAGTDPVQAGHPGTCASRSIDRLSFGLSGPQGDIGDAAWQTFLAEQITPRFPAGHTVFEARGQWLGTDGQVVQERSRVLEVVHDGSPQQQRRVHEIVALYKSEFAQEAVLVTRNTVLACL